MIGGSRLRRRLAALALATLLAAPAPAFGQSAGDEQYEDPFAGEQQQQQPEPTPTPQPAAPAEPGAAPAEQAPAPTPEPVPAAPQGGEPGPQQPELPRTGLDAGPLLALGAVLLAGGIVLRLRLRERA